jgi:hypothetical protein
MPIAATPLLPQAAREFKTNSMRRMLTDPMRTDIFRRVGVKGRCAFSCFQFLSIGPVTTTSYLWSQCRYDLGPPVIAPTYSSKLQTQKTWRIGLALGLSVPPGFLPNEPP